ncbi:collagen-like protein [Pontibacter silvestris]|uniref:Collagen-like protein n=1 Tax=Pontibacter silvestris TaxID=2305183 RepID=A0ABW4WSP7_9BACT|nr:collagen-like protein [Pontibacter silvestris]MCC9137688.1 collagen-like protein [Pontibacter silvestris]
MKKLLQFFLILAVAFGHVACEGDEGPPGPQGEQGEQGPQGEQGEPGESSTAQAYDFNWTFEPDEDGYYYYGFNFAEIQDADVTVSNSDIILVYWNPYESLNLGTDIWMPLPQTMFLQDGILSVSYLYTTEFLEIDLNAGFDLATTPSVTDNQRFRMVVIPGELLNGRTAGAPVDYKNYEEVVKYFNISEDNVKKIQLQ